MSNILLKNANIISGTSGELQKDNLLINKDIGISGNIIRFIKDAGSKGTGPDGNFKADRIIDCSGKIVMPGLVNTHTHTAMTLFRNYGNDLSLQDWLFTKIFPAEDRMTGDDVYWGTLLGIAEMISSGTTACADMYLMMDNAAKAYAESGMRVNMAPGPFKFVSTPAPHMVDETDWFKSFYRQWNQSCNGRIKVYIQAHSVYILDGEKLKKTSELAELLDTGIHIHILETEKEKEESFKLHGTGVVETCVNCGIFERPVIAAHCVYLDDNDMETFRKHNTNAVHNPVSNLKLGSGIADVPAMLNAGINVALGTDGAASNNCLDMLEEMKFAALLNKGRMKDPVVVSAAETIRMATVNGAKAIGEAGRIGIIREGCIADIIVIDMKSPHLRPCIDPVADIVYCAKGSDVETVIIDGQIVMENREIKTIDVEKAIYMVEKSNLSGGLAYKG